MSVPTLHFRSSPVRVFLGIGAIAGTLHFLTFPALFSSGADDVYPYTTTEPDQHVAFL